MAVALGDRTTRLQLRDALRASPITEHKLVLATFVETDAGRAFVAGIAHANSRRNGEVESLIRSLPPMELVVPLREHRLTWTGEANEMRVAAVMARGATSIMAYGVDGSAHALTSRTERLSQPLLVLRPERGWSRRVGVGPYRPGSVIQEWGENEISGTITSVTADGKSVTTEIADLPVTAFRTALMAGQRPNGATGSQPAGIKPGVAYSGGSTADTTWLISLQVHYEAPGDDASTDPFFNACYRFWYAQGFCTENRIVHFWGLNADAVPIITYYPVVPLVFHAVTDSTLDDVQVNVSEADQWWHNNIFLTSWDLTWKDSVWRDPFNGTFFYWNNAGCPNCMRVGFYSRRQFAPPPPPPPPLTVAITGPASIRSNATCEWVAHASGGHPQYTYAWKRNGTNAGSGATYDGSGTTAFTLSVTATDSLNATATATKSVTISSLAPICNQ
jgi:hypothetical protein